MARTGRAPLPFSVRLDCETTRRAALTARKDVIETFFDSRLDLFNRRLRAQSNRLKSRAVEMLPKQLRTPKGGGILLLDDEGQDEGKGTERNKSRGERYKEDVEREVERIKIKVGESSSASRVKLMA